ncbi:MAG: hypothetical protein K2K08_01175 [Paramuribaculum sp.]|nr:hypothetical protein [Paramuribaculum sp.]
MGKVLKYLICLIIGAVAWCCNTVGCMQNQSSIPLAGFYDGSTDKKISLDSITVFGIGAPNDSSLISTRTASMVYLPFRSDNTSTSFCFRYLAKHLDHPELNDTISFTYTSQPKFVSEECGAMYFYTITGVRYTTHLIDSVAVTDSLINNLDTERIKIFFRVAHEEEDPGNDDNEEL